jgi:hypothetical protein
VHLKLILTRRVLLIEGSIGISDIKTPKLVKLPF